jgi:hypothetical protein
VLFSIPEQTDCEDYRDVDGVNLPFTIRTSNIGTFFSSTRKFTEIKHNTSVDDAYSTCLPLSNEARDISAPD